MRQSRWFSAASWLAAGCPLAAQPSLTWTLVSTSGPAPRVGHAMVWDSVRERVVLMGGVSYWPAGVYVPETWEWYQGAWRCASRNGDGEQRFFHAMAFDVWRSVTVAHGGWHDDCWPLPHCSLFSAQTWEREDTTWKLQARDDPANLMTHAMAFDAARGVSIMFGGQADSFAGIFPVNDTWQWNGKLWQQPSPPSAPSPRFGHSMAYDSARGVIVLYGGGTNTNINTETWEWDGQTWTLRATSGPAASIYAPIAYHAARGTTILFGGVVRVGQSFDSTDETWEWDGDTWRRLNLPVCPSPRHYHAMAYDPIRERIVMFGGTTTNGNIVNGETWELCLPAPCYPDCDTSTGPGILDIFDFLCFGNRFEARDPYACDCDTSTGQGVCDILDFLCFGNAFSAGCS